MVLVTYSDSSEAEDQDIHKGPVSSSTARQQSSIPPPAKRRRLSVGESGPPSPSSESPPPLPASFHNLYSSSVRVSTRDDPSLHGGRKRIVPHIPGNWAAHVYLEWLPGSSQHTLLSNLITAVTNSSVHNTSTTNNSNNPQIHSLLETPLGVTTPLHISLSAPLVLRTETKDAYLTTLLRTLNPIVNAHKSAVTTTPDNLSWHLNEDGSRGFLVLRVLEIPNSDGQDNRALSDQQGEEAGEKEEQQRREVDVLPSALPPSSPKEERVVIAAKAEHGVRGQDAEQSGLGGSHEQGGQHTSAQSRGRGDGGSSSSSSSSSSRNSRNSRHGLNDLLHASNKVAKEFGQPELYVAKARNRDSSFSTSSPSTGRGDFSGYFHISIAWALSVPASSHQPPNPAAAAAGTGKAWTPDVEEILEEVKKMRIIFQEVKVRIGKDVTDIPLGAKKRADNNNKKNGFFGV